MKTKDIKQLTNFHIPLSWCSSLSEHKRLNEAYIEILEVYAETDWSYETADGVKQHIKNKKMTVELGTYARAERYFVQNLLEHLERENIR